MPVLYTTKDLEVIEPPTAEKEGVGIFEFTDDYTVFFFGRMPDQIPGKGAAHARMAAFNFRMLEEAGVPTHFRRFIAPNKIEFDLARIVDPAVEALTPDSVNYVVPLQVLCRNELPQGSSVHRRLVAGALLPADLGLSGIPAVGERLQPPAIEYATMLEEPKRFIDALQARQLAGLSDGQFQAMREITLTANGLITRHASELGVNHSDGNFEYLVSSGGRIVLADSPGTPDGNRFLFDGVHCGKQILRNWYSDNGLEPPVKQWVADSIPRAQWTTAASLPPDFIPVMSDLYRSLSEAWTGERTWNAPDLPSAIQAVRRLTGQRRRSPTAGSKPAPL